MLSLLEYWVCNFNLVVSLNPGFLNFGSVSLFGDGEINTSAFLAYTVYKNI